METTDFTVRNASTTFHIDYIDHGISLSYDPLHERKGCWFVSLEKYVDEGVHMWVSDESNNEKAADTRRSRISQGFICTKWAHIWVGKY